MDRNRVTNVSRGQRRFGWGLLVFALSMILLAIVGTDVLFAPEPTTQGAHPSSRVPPPPSPGGDGAVLMIGAISGLVGAVAGLIVAVTGLLAVLKGKKVPSWHEV